MKISLFPENILSQLLKSYRANFPKKYLYLSVYYYLVSHQLNCLFYKPKSDLSQQSNNSDHVVGFVYFSSRMSAVLNTQQVRRLKTCRISDRDRTMLRSCIRFKKCVWIALFQLREWKNMGIFFFLNSSIFTRRTQRSAGKRIRATRE